MAIGSLSSLQVYTGEIISLGVAASWTITALCFEYAGKRIGALPLNIIRLPEWWLPCLVSVFPLWAGVVAGPKNDILHFLPKVSYLA